MFSALSAPPARAAGTAAAPRLRALAAAPCAAGPWAAGRPTARSLRTGAAAGFPAARVLADDAPEEPHLRVDAAEYRAALAAEEEADEFEELEEGEVVEVDAAAVPDDSLALENFNLTAKTMAALKSRGVERLFPIQGATFGPLSEGRDLIGRARTGTGKTLAFSLPIIEKLVRADAKTAPRSRRPPRFLVMAPTRELALQVEREITATAPSLACVCIYGGASVSAQEMALRRGADVVVGTPGRLIDLVTRGTLDFSALKHVVLDEADQMLAVGFEQDVEQLMEAMPQDDPERQVLLFSATMPHWVKKLSRQYLRDPVTVDLVGDSSAKIAPTITMASLCCDMRAKTGLLADLVSVHAAGAKAIVFTATKRECDEVAAALGRRCASEALHGDIAQGQREKTLRKFREGRISVLVATDVAARGLDIPDVDLVLHYNLPHDTESFVHRSGRTGRAGRAGRAIVLHTEREGHMLRRLAKETGANFDKLAPPSAHDVMLASATVAVEQLTTVDPKLLPFFTAAADKLIAAQGASAALAAALAVVSGHTEPPATRSLLTGEEGTATLRIRRSSPSGPGIKAARDVLRILQRIPLPGGRADATPADRVGKIRMVEGGADESAVVDLPTAVADALMAMGDLAGIVFEPLPSLPTLVAEFQEPSSGRYSSGGRGYGGGGGRGYGGGYGGRDSQGGGRSYGGDRFGESRGGGGGGRGYGGDRFGGGRSSESRGGGGGYGGGGGGYGGGGGGGGYGGGSRSGFGQRTGGGGGGGRSYSSGAGGQ